MPEVTVKSRDLEKFVVTKLFKKFTDTCETSRRVTVRIPFPFDVTLITYKKRHISHYTAKK
jgi:hypothetical protein